MSDYNIERILSVLLESMASVAESEICRDCPMIRMVVDVLKNVRSMNNAEVMLQFGITKDKGLRCLMGETRAVK